MRRTLLLVVLGVFAAIWILISAAFVLDWTFNRAPVNIARLKALQPGATREEVKLALGEPKNIYATNRTWAYSRPFGWSIVYVYFDGQGHFQKYEFDY